VLDRFEALVPEALDVSPGLHLGRRGRRCQEAADFSARELTRVNVPVRLAVRQSLSESRLGACRGAPVGGDVGRVVARGQREIQDLVIRARHDAQGEAGERRRRRRYAGGSRPRDRGRSMNVRSRGIAQKAGEGAVHGQRMSDVVVNRGGIPGTGGWRPLGRTIEMGRVGNGRGMSERSRAHEDRRGGEEGPEVQNRIRERTHGGSLPS